MKKIKRLLCSLAWIFLIAQMQIHLAFAAEEKCDTSIKVHVDLHAPSAFLNDQGEVVGMDADLIRAIIQETGCQLVWDLVPMSGERILRSLEKGEIDVMIRASITPQRQEYALFSEAYRSEVVGVFSRESYQLPANLSLQEALSKNYILIGPVSGWYGSEFESLRKQWRNKNLYTPYRDAYVATKLLFATQKRGDILLVDADIFFHYLNPTQLADVNLFAQWIYVTPSYLMFSKKTITAKLLTRINLAISKLKKNATLQKIENKYRPKALQNMLKQVQKLQIL